MCKFSVDLSCMQQNKHPWVPLPESCHGIGKTNPANEHGGRTKASVEMRKAIAELVREAKELDGVVE